MKAAPLFLALLLGGAPVLADDVEARASEAMTNIIFDYDGSNEFISYHIRTDGFIDVVFASNTPEPLYNEIVGKLRADANIKGVLSGRGGPVCSRF